MKKLYFALLSVMLVFLLAIPIYASIQANSYSAIVMDFETGEILFERDIHTARVPTSTTIQAL